MNVNNWQCLVGLGYQKICIASFESGKNKWICAKGNYCVCSRLIESFVQVRNSVRQQIEIHRFCFYSDSQSSYSSGNRRWIILILINLWYLNCANHIEFKKKHFRIYFNLRDVVHDLTRMPYREKLDSSLHWPHYEKVTTNTVGNKYMEVYIHRQGPIPV